MEIFLNTYFSILILSMIYFIAKPEKIRADSPKQHLFFLDTEYDVFNSNLVFISTIYSESTSSQRII